MVGPLTYVSLPIEDGGIDEGKLRAVGQCGEYKRTIRWLLRTPHPWGLIVQKMSIRYERTHPEPYVNIFAMCEEGLPASFEFWEVFLVFNHSQAQGNDRWSNGYMPLPETRLTFDGQARFFPCSELPGGECDMEDLGFVDATLQPFNPSFPDPSDPSRNVTLLNVTNSLWYSTQQPPFWRNGDLTLNREVTLDWDCCMPGEQSGSLLPRPNSEWGTHIERDSHAR